MSFIININHYFHPYLISVTYLYLQNCNKYVKTGSWRSLLFFVSYQGRILSISFRKILSPAISRSCYLRNKQSIRIMHLNPMAQTDWFKFRYRFKRIKSITFWNLEPISFTNEGGSKFSFKISSWYNNNINMFEVCFTVCAWSA